MKKTVKLNVILSYFSLHWPKYIHDVLTSFLTTTNFIINFHVVIFLWELCTTKLIYKHCSSIKIINLEPFWALFKQLWNLCNDLFTDSELKKCKFSFHNISDSMKKTVKYYSYNYFSLWQPDHRDKLLTWFYFSILSFLCCHLSKRHQSSLI